MEEKTSQPKVITTIEAISIILIITVNIGFFLYNLFRMWCRSDIYCFGFSISGLIFYFIFFLLFLAIILEVIAVLIRKKNNLPLKKSTDTFAKYMLFLIISAIVILSFFSLDFCESRSKARDARRQSDLRQIVSAQEMFFGDNFRYANSQEELIKYLPHPASDPITQKEYTDEDGVGIEGGDKDPNTWSIQTELEGDHREICGNKGTKTIFFCNEKGCKTK